MVSNNQIYLKKAVEFYEKSKANYLKSLMISRLGNEQEPEQYLTQDESNTIKKSERKKTTRQNDISSSILFDSNLIKESQHLAQTTSRKTPKNVQYSLNSTIPTFNIDSLQSKIPKETGILLYHISNYWNGNEGYHKKDRHETQELVAFLIDNNHIEHFAIEFKKGENQLILNFIKSIRSGNNPEFLHYSSMIYKMLVAPFRQSISTKGNLVIIPDIELVDIPFESLLQDENSLPLCANFSTSYHYSMDLWVNGYSRSQRKFNYSLVAFAPDFTGENGAVNLPDSWHLSDSLIAQNRDFIKDENHLMPLPMAKEEVIRIGNIFNNSNGVKVLIEYNRTTKKHFIEIAEQYDIIHIASHGFTDQNDYRNSGIFFSKPVGNISLEERFLPLNEIYKLKTNADLVVLSACKTCIGEKVKGEGAMALPRGFIYAGVPNVIASLWKVNDEKTKDLMVAFYKHLMQEKVSYAVALQRAKLDCIKKGFLPMDWAGFLLTGN